MTHDHRFELAERNPQHGVAMGFPAPEVSRLTTLVVPSVFLFFWIATGIIVTSGFAHGDSPAMALFPAALLIAGVFAIGWHIRTSVRKANAPVMRTIAVLVDKRTEVSTHHHHHDGRRRHHTTTSYYATLEFRDGSRLELPTTDGVAGYSATGDIGLAVMRGGDLVDFHRFRL